MLSNISQSSHHNQKCASMTISLPLKEALFFGPAWGHKTDIFISSVLILTSSETKLFL